MVGFLPRQAPSVQGGADGFAAAQASEPRLYEADQPLERPARLRVGPGYRWAGGLLLRSTGLLARRCLDAGAKEGGRRCADRPAPRGRARCSCAPGPSRSAQDGRACGHLRGAGALGDLVQGKETLERAIMRGGQGLAAQVCLRLVPALMVNSQPGPDDAFRGKPSWGDHRSVTQCRGCGFQTGRSLESSSLPDRVASIRVDNAACHQARRIGSQEVDD